MTGKGVGDGHLHSALSNLLGGEGCEYVTLFLVFTPLISLPNNILYETIEKPSRLAFWKTRHDILNQEARSNLLLFSQL